MTAEALKNFSLADAVVTGVVGFSIVFFVLVVLMIMIKVVRGAVSSMESGRAASAQAAAATAAPAKAAAAPSNMIPAKGSLGEVKLHDVDDRTAALLMAIVADKMEAPLNELRFLSIREKK